jgi:hypothetical protein
MNPDLRILLLAVLWCLDRDHSKRVVYICQKEGKAARCIVVVVHRFVAAMKYSGEVLNRFGIDGCVLFYHHQHGNSGAICT